MGNKSEDLSLDEMVVLFDSGGDWKPRPKTYDSSNDRHIEGYVGATDRAQLKLSKFERTSSTDPEYRVMAENNNGIFLGGITLGSYDKTNYKKLQSLYKRIEKRAENIRSLALEEVRRFIEREK